MVTPSVEHIIPDALGCPDHFILKSCVCKSCNNGLGYIDQALINDFAIVAFMVGIPGKGGKPPSITTWSPVASNYENGEKQLHLNADKQPVIAAGKNLKPATRSTGITNVTFDNKNGQAEVRFTQDFGKSPRFFRALMKVALGAVALYLGPEIAASPQYNAVREFVLTGKGSFRALLVSPNDAPGYSLTILPPAESCDYEMAAINILGVTLLVDFDPDQKGLACVQSAAKSDPDLKLIPL